MMLKQVQHDKPSSFLVIPNSFRDLNPNRINMMKQVQNDNSGPYAFILNF
jgi:hypothetical protein